MPTTPEHTDRPQDRRPPAAPHGPHHDQVDPAAGGTDSAPFEIESTGEREAEARTAKPRGVGRPPA